MLVYSLSLQASEIGRHRLERGSTDVETTVSREGVMPRKIAPQGAIFLYRVRALQQEAGELMADEHKSGGFLGPAFNGTGYSYLQTAAQGAGLARQIVPPMGPSGAIGVPGYLSNSYRGVDKFHGTVTDIISLPARMLKPISQFEMNGAISSMKKSGLSPVTWARTIDRSDPIEASLFNSGELRITDGHHRQLAAEILGENIPVKLQAINAKASDINRLLQFVAK